MWLSMMNYVQKLILENTPPVQEKTMEVDDSILEDYVGKHSDEEL